MPEYGIGSLGLRDSVTGNPRVRNYEDLYQNTLDTSQLDTSAGSLTDTSNRVRRLFDTTPETSFQTWLNTPGETIEENINNLNQTDFFHLVRKGFFGDEAIADFEQMQNNILADRGSLYLSEFDGGGGAQKLREDVYNKRNTYKFNKDMLGQGNETFRDLKIKKDLYEQLDQQIAQTYADPSLANFGRAMIFMDGNYKKDVVTVDPDIVETFDYQTKTGEFIFDNNTSVFYTQYDSKEDVYADKQFFKDYFEFGDARTGPRGIKVDAAKSYINNNIEEGGDGKFYVALEHLDPGKEARFKNLVSIEDPSQIAGQAVALVDIAIMPVSGIYSGIVRSAGKGLTIGFTKTGELTSASLNALQSAYKAGQLTLKELQTIKRQGKVKVLYAESRKGPSITKRARLDKKDLIVINTRKNTDGTTYKSYASQKEIDDVVALRNKDYTAQEIISKLGFSEHKVHEILRFKGFGFGSKALQIANKNEAMMKVAKYLDNIQIDKSIGFNSKAFKKMQEDLGLNSATLRQYIKDLTKEVKAQRSGSGATRGLVLPENLLSKLNLLPSSPYMDEILVSQGFSAGAASNIIEVNQAVKKLMNFSNFEHAFAQGFLKSKVFNPGYKVTGQTDEALKKYYEMGVRTSNALNTFKMQFDGQLVKLAEKRFKGNITQAEYMKEVNKIRDTVQLATGGKMTNGKVTGGYEIGYMKFVDGKPIPVTTQKSALEGVGEFGPQTTAIINFFKNIKHNNALYKNWKVNKKDKIYGTLRTEKFQLHKDLAKVYDDIKDFKTQKEFIKYYENNKNSPFFKALIEINKKDKQFGYNRKELYAAFAAGTLTSGMLSTQLSAEELEGEKTEGTIAESDGGAEGGRVKGGKGLGYELLDKTNLYGFNIDEIIEKQKLIDKGLYEEERTEVPEGKFDPYAFAKIIDLEDEYLQKKRELGYKPIGQELKDRIKKRAETAFSLLSTEKKLDSVIEETKELLNPGKPSKFKFSETPRLVTQNPLLRQALGNVLSVGSTSIIALKSFADDIVGMMEGKGEGFERTKNIIPNLYKVSRSLQPEFASEDEYISVIDEINKMMDAGINNLAFSFVDAISMGIDFMADTNTQQKVADLYDEADIAEPETFLGKLGALGVEIGAPVGGWLKVMNRARKWLRVKGVNTFVDKSTDAYGTAYALQKVSNIAKRVGVGATLFGVSDATTMSRFSTVNKLFDHDPLLLTDKESIEGLSGRELALANLRNRVRFGADGAMIGGLFPLVGPPAWAVTKVFAKGVGSTIGGGVRTFINPPMTSIANTLAGKSTVLTRAAEDAIAVVTGMRPELTGPIGKTGQVVSETIQAVNNFVGKQIVTRALLGAQDLTQIVTKNLYGRGINMEPKGVSQLTFLTRQLPERKEWSMFSVNTYDPLKQNLARIDNVMGVFRDIGKLTSDAFFLSTEAKLFIKSNMRATQDYLKLIENEAYNLAQNFQKRYNRYGESKHIQNHYMDQVLGYLRGKVKLKDIAPELKKSTEMLNNHLTNLRKKYADLLPKGSAMKDYMETNLREYMRKSFSMFTNPNFYPSKASIAAARKYMAEMIEKDPLLRMQAKESFPNMPIGKAIAESAELRIADFMETLRYEMDDPLIAMEIAAKKNLGLDDLVIRSGEELPSVLRKLLGEENNLKSSVLQTAGSLTHQAAQKIALDKIGELGLKGGWLFRTASEASQQGKILNAQQVKETGTGLLHTDTVGLYGAPEIVGQLNGFNMFDSILKNKIYHNLIAFKATVQGGKTLYSPATQARNFGSASLFALNQGHIGGKVTVGESFKMIMDDIFGAGKNADPIRVVQNIQRKIRLGVLDENVVAEELGAVLRELKGQKGLYSMTGLTNKIGDTQLTKLVQRLYAGGDNVWKWHGHEYVKSQLTGKIRSIDEISDYFKNVVGREFKRVDEFTGNIKTVAEGIEEMAAYIIRETYPTYSRVPPVIQALRKFPFGNFISFPAEIMRTTFAAAGLSLKHIASDNPTLRAMGYKGLLGQLTTLYGVGATTQAISSAMTGIDKKQTDAYTNTLGPEYMRFHQLIPITTKQKNGSFKAFDMSAYNPYDYMIAPIQGIIQNLGMIKLGTTPNKVDQDMFNAMFAVDGPLASLISPFVAETIGLEPFFDVLPAGYAVGGRSGVTKSGSKVYNSEDEKDVKFNKSIAHILSSILPGVYSTGKKLYGSLQADISQGQQINLGDQLFKLMGGSVIIVNPVKALDYKISDIRKIRSEAFSTENFYSEKNWQNRPASVLVEEFRNIQEQAFKEQFEVWRMFNQSIESGLLKKRHVEKVLRERGFSGAQIRKLLSGEFMPVTLSDSAMKKRAKNIKDAYPGVFIKTDDLYPKYKLKDVIYDYKYLKFKNFLDPDTVPEKPVYKEKPELSQVTTPDDIQVAQLPDTGPPVVNPNQMANVSGPAINPQTGLTDSQSVYLSPTEKLYYQRNRTV